MLSPVLLTTFLALVSGIPGRRVYYVIPDSPSICPVEQCLTLDQYVQQSRFYISTGSTFVFMAGNHSLKNTVHVFNISNVTFVNEGRRSDARILYSNESAFYCDSVQNLKIDGLTFILHSNENSSAVKVFFSSEVRINNSAFLGNGILVDTFSRAVHSVFSEVIMTSCLFEGGTGDDGGAVHASGSSAIYLSGNVFSKNKSMFRGGALYASGGSVSIDGDEMNHFKQNSANQGGAVYTERGCRLNITSKYLNFTMNIAHEEGGAIYAASALKLLGDHHYFAYNSALQGGAIYSTQDLTDQHSVSFLLSNTIFYHNEAHSGAGIFLFGSRTQILSGVTFSSNVASSSGGGMYVMLTFRELKIFTMDLNFIGNIAKREGGGLYISSITSVLIRGNFTNNSAKLCGGAISIAERRHSIYIDFRSVTVEGNFGSAICVSDSQATFSGTTHMSNNTGYTGGAIYLKRSFLSFTGQSVLLGNKAYAGGAIYSTLGSTVLFQGSHSLLINTAETDGGAIHAMGTNITMYNTTLVFTNNSAQRGGAVYFSREATLTMAGQVLINTSHNHATEFGGALYHEDNTVPIQCNFIVSQGIELLPSCFLHVRGIVADFTFTHMLYKKIHSYGDTAGEDGSFLYGGLLDRCQMAMKNYSNPVQKAMVPYNFLQDEIFNFKPVKKLTEITSHPYQLCFCESSQNHGCTETHIIEVHRGQKFNVSLTALDQTNNFRPALVTAKISETASLNLHESLQVLTEECSNLTFTIHSTESHENLILYPDGPCHDTGLARAVIKVTVISLAPGHLLNQVESALVKRGYLSMVLNAQ